MLNCTSIKLFLQLCAAVFFHLILTQKYIAVTNPQVHTAACGSSGPWPVKFKDSPRVFNTYISGIVVQFHVVKL